MAIDWSTLKPAIAGQIATLTGLDPRLVKWVDEPSGNLAGASPIVWLRVSSMVPVGVEYETRTDNGTGDQTVSVVGHRDFTLSIRIESFALDLANDNHSANVGEALRIRLKRSTSIAARSGIFAIREVLMTKWISYIESQRTITAYLMDLLCAAVDVDIDDTDGAGDWIGEADITGTIKDGPPDSTIANVSIVAKTT